MAPIRDWTGAITFFPLPHKIMAQPTNIGERGWLIQKHKKQPFSDASASHLPLALWHV